MSGIGRDCGKDKSTPCCNCLKRYPASLRASVDSGGVLISPCKMKSSLSPSDAIDREYAKLAILTTKKYDYHLDLDSMLCVRAPVPEVAETARGKPDNSLPWALLQAIVKCHARLYDLRVKDRCSAKIKT